MVIISTIALLTVHETLKLGRYLTPDSIGGFIAAKFSVSIVLGVLFSFFLASFLYRVRRQRHIYTAILACLIFLYALAEFLGGTGAIAVLTAGFMLANLDVLPSIITSKEKVEIIKYQRISLESFHSELTLLIRVFFFIEIGLIFNLGDPSTLALAGIISIILLMVRYPVASLVSKMIEKPDKVSTIAIFYPRGLVAAVLAFEALQVTQLNIFTEIVSGIVIITNIVATIGYHVLKRGGVEPIILYNPLQSRGGRE